MTTSQRLEHNETIRFRALRLLEHQPHLTQRQLAQELGISVGKVNFLLKALAEKGLIKFSNFQHGDDKLNKLAYLLTPEGLQHRLSLTRAYLERKTRQYEALQAELASLRAEVGATAALPTTRAGDAPGAGGMAAMNKIPSPRAGEEPNEQGA